MKNILPIIYFTFFSIAAHGADESRSTQIITLNELVAESNLIVIGRIDGIIFEGPFFGYDKSGNIKSPEGRDPEFGLPTIDFRVVVEETLYDPENIYENGELALRLMGETSDPRFSKMYSTISGRSLFFLTQNPDKESYGFSNYKHIIHIDETIPKYTDFEKDGLFYLYEEGNISEPSTEMFIDKVEATIINFLNAEN